MIRKFGLIGFPLTHSFSKKYFEEKFVREGINDAQYDLFPINSIQQLLDLIKSQKYLEGVNVTIPYKEQVLQYCDELSEEARTIGAVNCLKISNGKIAGYNTDVIGFEKSLLPLLQPYLTHALILGSGGSSRAVQYVLGKLGIDFKLVSRNTSKCNIQYNDLDEEIFSSHKLIVNTTPLGMYPDIGEKLDLPYELITQQHLLYDLIYNPEETQFLLEGKQRSATTKNGLEMLKIQAEESWSIWNS